MPARDARTRRSARPCPAPARAGRPSTPASARARWAPATSPSMTSVCQEAATMATRRPLPSAVTAGRRVHSRAGSLVARVDHEVVAHPVALGAQVGAVGGVRRDREALDGRDVDAVARIALRPWPGCSSAAAPTTSPRAVRIAAPAAYSRRVDRQVELELGVDGVEARVLQGVGLQLGDQPDAAPLVAAQVDERRRPRRRSAPATARAGARSRSAATRRRRR